METSIKVLVLEDSEADFIILQDALEVAQAGCEMRWVQTLKAATKVFGETSFDIVIYDLNLPDSKGVDGFARFIEIVPDLPVIVVTGSLDSEVGDRVIAMGAQDFIGKNHLDGATVWKSIRYASERHRLLRERLKLQEKVHQVERFESISTLAAGLAHDIGNLLTPSLMSAELGLLSTQEPALRELFEDIRNSSKMASELSRQLMAMKASDMDGEMRALSFGDTYDRAVSLVAKVVHPSIRFEWERCPFEYSLKFAAQFTDLQQIVLNLVNNSMQALRSRSQGSISVLCRLDTDSDEAVVVVKDDGPGFSEETRSMVFEPFYTTKGDVGGTGLGLSNCQRIVERLNGRISLDNWESGGAEVTVRLPLIRLEELEEESIDSLFSEGESMRILFADDDEHLGVRAKEFFTFLGFDFEHASDPKVALEALDAKKPAWDIVVADYSMGSMNGLQMIERMRELGLSCPAIMVTSFADLLSQDQLRAAKVDKVLSKPFTAQELVKAIRSLMVGS